MLNLGQKSDKIKKTFIRSPKKIFFIYYDALIPSKQVTPAP